MDHKFGFGRSTAVSGDSSIYVVGNPSKNEVCVYSDVESKLSMISVVGPKPDIGFGYNVDITDDGRTMIIGTVSGGGAYIYNYVNGEWEAIAFLSTRNAHIPFGSNVTISGNGNYSYILDGRNSNLHIYENETYLEICILKDEDYTDIAVSFDGTTIALVGCNPEHYAAYEDVHIFKIVDKEQHIKCRFEDKYLVKYSKLHFSGSQTKDTSKIRIAISATGDDIVVCSSTDKYAKSYHDDKVTGKYLLSETFEIGDELPEWHSRELTLSSNGDICNIVTHGLGELKRFRLHKVEGWIEEYSEKLSQEARKGFGFNISASNNGRNVLIGYMDNYYVYLHRSTNIQDTNMFLSRIPLS